MVPRGSNEDCHDMTKLSSELSHAMWVTGVTFPGECCNEEHDGTLAKEESQQGRVSRKDTKGAPEDKLVTCSFFN